MQDIYFKKKFIALLISVSLICSEVLFLLMVLRDNTCSSKLRRTNLEVKVFIVLAVQAGAGGWRKVRRGVPADALRGLEDDPSRTGMHAKKCNISMMMLSVWA